MFGGAWPRLRAADFDVIRTPIDFLGINYYTRGVMRDAPGALPLRADRVPQRQHLTTETGWEVFPEALDAVLAWVHARYGGIPLYITENGAAFYDAPHAIDGAVEDPLRVAYYRWHLRAVRQAMARGIPVRGYFAWSLLDNFEWSLGYAKRFGIVHVNFDTQERTPKSSAHFYRDVIRTRGAALGQ